jgi:hypothetical protein
MRKQKKTAADAAVATTQDQGFNDGESSNRPTMRRIAMRMTILRSSRPIPTTVLRRNRRTTRMALVPKVTRIVRTANSDTRRRAPMKIPIPCSGPAATTWCGGR